MDNLPTLLSVTDDSGNLVLRIDQDSLCLGTDSDTNVLCLTIRGYEASTDNAADLRKSVGKVIEFDTVDDSQTVELRIDYGAVWIHIEFNRLERHETEYTRTDLLRKAKYLAHDFSLATDRYWELAHKQSSMVKEIRDLVEDERQRCERKLEHFESIDSSAGKGYRDNLRLIERLKEIVKSNK